MLPPPVLQFLALVPPAHGAVQVRDGLVVLQSDALFLALDFPFGLRDWVCKGEACGFFRFGHGVKKPAGAGWVWGGGLANGQPVLAHNPRARNSFPGLDGRFNLRFGWRRRLGVVAQ